MASSDIELATQIAKQASALKHAGHIAIDSFLAGSAFAVWWSYLEGAVHGYMLVIGVLIITLRAIITWRELISGRRKGRPR